MDYYWFGPCVQDSAKLQMDYMKIAYIKCASMNLHKFYVVADYRQK